MYGLTGMSLCESLYRLPVRILHVSLLKSPNSSTPSAAKIKKRSMKRRPRFPTCRETTGGGRDSVRGVLPTQRRKGQNLICCVQKVQQKTRPKHIFSTQLSNSLRMTAIGLKHAGVPFSSSPNSAMFYFTKSAASNPPTIF